MAVNGSYLQSGPDYSRLIREAGLKRYGVFLPGLYCDLVLSRKLTLRAAVIEYLNHDTPYPSEGFISQ